MLGARRSPAWRRPIPGARSSSSAGLEGALLLGNDGGRLLLDRSRHQDLASRPTQAIAAPDGSGYFIGFGRDDAIGLAQ